MEPFPAEKSKSDSHSLSNFGSFFASKLSEGLMFDVSVGFMGVQVRQEQRLLVREKVQLV